LDDAVIAAVEDLAKRAGVEITRLGRTGGKDLKVLCQGAETVWAVAELRDGFEKSLPKALEP
jgi:hypothetical protein